VLLVVIHPDQAAAIHAAQGAAHPLSDMNPRNGRQHDLAGD